MNPETTSTFQVCNRCIMDTSAKDISFDTAGNCNFCNSFLMKYRERISISENTRMHNLEKFVQELKKSGKKNQYDCVIGVSGGVDSSWALAKAVEMGLRPLAVHMDNGWNSELAQNNISNLVQALQVDLVTKVIDWQEYKALMQSFFDADVIDVELLYDNAMLEVNFHQAKKFGVKYILSGSNFSTEGLEMPSGWNWLKYDGRNIRSIARLGHVKLSSFPLMTTARYLRYRGIQKISWIPFLDFFEYQKNLAVEELERDFGFKRYPYKHYESIFTRFYQAVILPQKFHVDKRKLHLSNLVLTGQLSRSDAIDEIQLSTYPSNEERVQDLKYFLKKMEWSEEDLDRYLTRPERGHGEFGSEKAFWNMAMKTNHLLRRSHRVI